MSSDRLAKYQESSQDVTGPVQDECSPDGKSAGNLEDADVMDTESFRIHIVRNGTGGTFWQKAGPRQYHQRTWTGHRRTEAES